MSKENTTTNQTPKTNAFIRGANKEAASLRDRATIEQLGARAVRSAIQKALKEENQAELNAAIASVLVAVSSDAYPNETVTSVKALA